MPLTYIQHELVRLKDHPVSASSKRKRVWVNLTKNLLKEHDEVLDHLVVQAVSESHAQ